MPTPHHSLADCPLQQQQATSGCYLKYNKRSNKGQRQIISFCSAELIQLLGYDPTLKEISEIWELLFQDYTTPYTFVQTSVPDSTALTTAAIRKLKRKALCICIHEEDNTILCADITDNSKRYQRHVSSNTATISRSKGNNYTMIISRLTQYGTIDAIFHLDDSSQNTVRMDIGQPIMKYIHLDDLQRFCAGLSQATKHYYASSLEHSSTVMVTFSVRLLLPSHPLLNDGELYIDSDMAYLKTELTVMTVENGKILCFMRPLCLVSGNNITLAAATAATAAAAASTGESIPSINSSCISSASSSITDISSCNTNDYYYKQYKYHNDDEGANLNNEYHYYYFPHNRLLFDTISHMQCKFWYALEHGMLALARHLANVLLGMLWMIIDYGYDAVVVKEMPIFWRKKCHKVLNSISTEPVTFSSHHTTTSNITTTSNTTTITTTTNTTTTTAAAAPGTTTMSLTMPPGVKTLCHGLNWILNKSPKKTRTWLDFTLGHTAEWLSVRSGYDIKAYYQHISNNNITSYSFC